MPLVPVCQTLQVEEQEQAQLPLDQTSWNKFASGSLLTGCAYLCSREIGGLDGAVMGVGDQCGWHLQCSVVQHGVGVEVLQVRGMASFTV